MINLSDNLYGTYKIDDMMHNKNLNNNIKNISGIKLNT